MDMKRTRQIRVSQLGPTVAELRELIQGINPEARVWIHLTEGDRPFDAGHYTLRVDEPPTPKHESEAF